MTRWNLDNLYPHYTGISKVVFLSIMNTFLKSVCCVKHAYLKQAHKCVLCELDCVKCRRCINCMTIFLKTTFGWSAGKNNSDFIQPLMAFRYSNICYCTLLPDNTGKQLIVYIGVQYGLSCFFACLKPVCKWINFCYV